MSNSWDGYQWTSPDGKRTFDLDERQQRFKTLVIGFDDSCDYNIKNYDGVDYTDNAQVVINAAVNRATALLNNEGFGRILFQSGTYNLSASIVIGGLGYVTLEGLKSAVLKRMANFAEGMITIAGLGEVTIKNLHLNGNKSNFSTNTNHGISIPSYSLLMTIEDCNIHNCAGSGIYVLGDSASQIIKGLTIKGCIVSDNYYDVNLRYVHDIWIQNLFSYSASNTSYRGIYIQDSTNINIHNCSITSTRAYARGIDILRSQNGTISGNRVYDHDSANVTLESCSDFSIVGNRLNNAPDKCAACLNLTVCEKIVCSDNICGFAVQNIEIASCLYITLKGNIVMNASFRGIYITSGGDIMVEGNHIVNNGSIGLTINAVHSVISNNVIKGNSGAGIYSTSPYLAITGNWIQGNTNKGINCAISSFQVAIVGNHVRDNQSDGIYAVGNDITITGNIVATSQAVGIYMGSTQNSVIVGNNLIANSGGTFGANVGATYVFANNTQR